MGPRVHFEMNTTGSSEPVPALAGVGVRVGVLLQGLNFMGSPLLGAPVLGLVRRGQLNHSGVTGRGMSWASEKGGDSLEGCMS